MFRFLVLALTIGVGACSPAHQVEEEASTKVVEVDKERVFLTLEQALRQPEAVYRLSLSGNDLESLPEAIGELHHLEELNLAGNNLRRLPETLNQLKQLKTLYLTGNAQLDWEHTFALLSKLPKLQYLNLHQCKIQQLPATIGKLKTLEELHLSANLLSALPDEISQLKTLRLLNISQNKGIKMLPYSIDQLKLQQLQAEGISLNEWDRARFHELLPDTELFFSPIGEDI